MTHDSTPNNTRRDKKENSKLKEWTMYHQNTIELKQIDDARN